MSPQPRTDNSSSQPLPESKPRISGKGGKLGKLGKLGGKNGKGSSGSLSAIKKPVKEGSKRKRPGMLALKEIKKMQAQTEAIIPRLPF